MSGTEDISGDGTSAGAAEAVAASARAERRRWWQMMRFLKGDRERRDRSLLVNALVTIVSSAIVAFTATWATINTTDRNISETRRGQRVDALVEQWSVAIADSSSAVELISQRLFDVVAYASVRRDSQELNRSYLDEESKKKSDYLKIRRDLAFSSAKTALVSSVNTNECLDKFVIMLDTWNEVLDSTVFRVQNSESFEGAVNDIAAQSENRGILTDAMSTVRLLARTELETAGTDSSNVTCDIPDQETMLPILVPNDPVLFGQGSQ